MKSFTAKQRTPFTKKKVGTELGFRTPDFFKRSAAVIQGSKFSNRGVQWKNNPSQFRTQHKGGGS